VAVFKRNDERTIYNAVYRDGKNGGIYVKRFAVMGVTRDKEYDVTQGKEGSQVLWFSANPNGEAEILKVYLNPRPKLKKLIFNFDFSQLAIKGRNTMGNILSRYAIHKIVLKEKGESTLGGRRIWFDPEVQRLNTEERGEYIGEFHAGERILAVTQQGTFYTTNYDLINRYEEQILLMEKFDAKKVYSATYYDAELKNCYVKRFTFEASDNTPQIFISEAAGSYLIEISTDRFPQLEITFKGKHAHRDVEYVNVDAFIGVKSFRAKGKRVTTYDVNTIEFVEPLEKEMPAGTSPSSRDGEAIQMSLL
jgi:topoisomerase-4 subunit A